MPELPEVQTVVDDLIRGSAIGKTVLRVDLFYEGSIFTPKPAKFCQDLSGQPILGVSRRGKWIVCTLQNFSLLIHLRMSGRILLANPSAPTSHERVRLHLSDGRMLKFEDQRKFGRMYLLPDPALKLNELGIEPLSAEFTQQYLQKLIQGKKKKIKALLLDQTLIAGLGNIYVDEALWLAQIHPETAGGLISKSAIQLLQQAIVKVLTLGIQHKGTSLGEGKANFHGASGEHGENLAHLQVYNQKGRPCKRCSQGIIKIVSCGRGTHLCPNCQIAPQT